MLRDSFAVVAIGFIVCSLPSACLRSKSIQASSSTSGNVSSTNRQVLAPHHLPSITVSRLHRWDSLGRQASHRGIAHRYSSTVSQDGAKSRLLGTEISQRQWRALEAVGVSDAHGTRHSNKAFLLGATRDGSEQEHMITAVSRLTDLRGSEYVGFIGVGDTGRSGSTGQPEPEVFLKVIYDTGSSDLWIASDLCHQGPCARIERGRFNHTNSQTFSEPRQPTKIQTDYGSGKLTGMLGFDDVHIGAIVARNVTLGLISGEVGPAFENLPMDGIIGLGFPALASEGTTPLVDTMLQQGSLPSRQFAFYLHPQAVAGGAVLWGGVDPRLFDGPMHWFPVAEREYWSLHLVGMSIGKFPISLGGYKHQVVVDSGTTFYTVPGSVLGQIKAQTGSFFDCHQTAFLPNLTFTLRDVEGVNRNIVITPKAYVVNGFSSDFCSLGIVTLSSFDGEDSNLSELMFLGEVFMRHFVTVFKREGPDGVAQVGLAKSASGVEVDNFFAELAA